MPNEKETEVDQFAQDTKSIVDQPLDLDPVVEENKGTEIETQEDDEAVNRRERRLRDKLQAEREANIDLAARLETISEAQKFRKDSEPGEYLKAVERLYGTNSPEAQEATEILKTALQGVEERATERALATFREEQRQEEARVSEEGRKLDTFIEEIEDGYNVSFTPEMRRGYFSLMAKMSPKDADGNLTAYADPDAVYEVFNERRQRKPDTRAKDLASRAMTTSGDSKGSNLQDDATVRALREAGII